MKGAILRYAARLAFGIGLGLAMTAWAQPGSGRVYVEDSPAAQQLMQQARQMLEADRPTRAVRQLQRVLKRYPHKLLPQQGGVYVDATEAVRRRLLSEATLLKAYRRVFGGEAQRLLDAAQSDGVSLSKLETLAARYPVTEAALNAELLAAGVYLERGDLSAAAGALEQARRHPGIDQHGQRYHQLQASLGVLRGDETHWQHHLEQLAQMGADKTVDAVRALAKATKIPDSQRMEAKPADLGPEPPAVVGEQALWTRNWAELAPAREERDEQWLERRTRRSHGRAPPVKPAVEGETVFVNAYQNLHALDRISGRVKWSFRWRPSVAVDADELDGRIVRRLTAGQSNPAAPRGVLIRQQTVYAVLGITLSSGRNDDEAPPMSPAVFAIDRDSGQARWRFDAEQLPDGLKQLQFYGTPRLAGERVLILGHRGTERASKDVFLIALDRSSGQVRWHRHVASLMAGQRDRGLAVRLRVARGRAYLSGPYGTAAAIAPRRGTVQWIRVAGGGEGQAGERRQDRDGALMAGRPLLVEAGLLVPRPLIAGPPLLLDPATGQTQRTLDRDRWAQAQRLVPVGQDVLLMGGSRLARMDGSTLQPRWQRTLDSPIEDPGLAPAVTGQWLAALTERGLVAVSLADGQQRMQRAVGGNGHLAAGPKQLLLADRKRVRSYMAWQDAEQALTARMQAEPTDPAPALSLSHLAIRSDHTPQAIHGADQAVAALQNLEQQAPDQAAKRQPEVFRQLLALARGQADQDQHQEIRRSLFRRVATVAQTPQQQVAYHLSLGRLEQTMGRHRQAVAHYQTVLLQPRLSKTRYASEGRQQHAGLEARSRLRQMIQEHGRAIYTRYEQRARQALEQARQRNKGVQALLEVAGQYPFAQAGTEARYQAARLLIADDQPYAAMIELRRAYQRASTAKRRGRIVSELAWLHERQNRADRARRWLKQVQRDHPELTLRRAGQRVSLEGWLSQLEATGSKRAGLPRLALPLRPGRVVDGQIVPAAGPSAGANLGRRATGVGRDGVLVRQGTTLRFYRGPGLEQRWTASLPSTGPWRTLQLNEQHLILWSPKQGGLLALNAKTGDRVWPARQAKAMLEQVGEIKAAHQVKTDQERRLMRLLNLRQRLRRQAQQLGRVPGVEQAEEAPPFRIASTPTVLTLVGKYGRAMGIAAHTGEVLWRRQLGMQRVSALAATERAVAIGGLAGVGTDAHNARLALLDPITGERLSPGIDQTADNPPLWVGVAGGRALVVGQSKVKAYSLETAEARWQYDPEEIRFAGPAWTSDRWLGVADQAGRVHVLNPADGQRQSTMTLGGVVNQGQGVALGERGYLHNGEQLVAISASGQQLWRDAIRLPVKRIDTLAATRQYLLTAVTRPVTLKHRGPQAALRPAPDEGVYALDRATGRLVEAWALPADGRLHKQPGEANQIRAVRPCGGGLAVGYDQRTLLLPGADSSR
jgi:outer membrane protein assembly factor BamB